MVEYPAACWPFYRALKLSYIAGMAFAPETGMSKATDAVRRSLENARTELRRHQDQLARENAQVTASAILQEEIAEAVQAASELATKAEAQLLKLHELEARIDAHTAKLRRAKPR